METNCLKERTPLEEVIMKTTRSYPSNWYMIYAIYYLIPALILIFTLAVSASLAAEEHVSYEGTLQGASCVHFKKKCPEDDAHIAIEHDFVLLLPNGDHYFLPNLNRAIKARYVGRPVRIKGTMEHHEIWVERLDVKKGDAYAGVWSWEKQQEL